MPFLSKVGYCVKKAFSAGVGFKSRVGFTPFSGDLCNVYVFTNANTDRLDFATPFTGNLKILIGGTSTTGINPAIPTTGWINSPDLNPDTLIYNEIEVTVAPDDIFNLPVEFDNSPNNTVINFTDHDIKPLTTYDINVTNNTNTQIVLRMGDLAETIAAGATLVRQHTTAATFNGTWKYFFNNAGVATGTVTGEVLENTVAPISYIADETFNGIVYAYAKDDVWYYVNMGDPTPPIEYENWLMEGDNLLIEGVQVVGVVQ